MTLTWLNHLLYTLICQGLFLLTLWLLGKTWTAWQYLQAWEQRYGRFLARQQRAQARSRSALPGLAQAPECAECQAEAGQPLLVVPTPPSYWTKINPQGRPREIQPTWQACPFETCRYYGWPGLGNLTANGHPNRARPRQWQCLACGQYFTETRGTVFYRRREAPQLVRQVLTALAEGLNIEGTARLCQVEVETVETWLKLATAHFEQLSAYLGHHLQIEQIQLDDLYVRLRAVQSQPGSSRRCVWLYNAFDPVSKFWLTFSLGDRSLPTVQHLVHILTSQLNPGCIPHFLTDGEASFEAAILTHFGQWHEVTPPDQPHAQPRPRWLPQPNLHYAQVIKHRRGRRLLYVTSRLVFGHLETLLDTLATHGWSLNTALIERFNLTLRQHVPALGRRTLALVQTKLTLSRQLTLVQTYTNFCLPHATLSLPAAGSSRPSSLRTPAMALVLTDRVWSLEELLLWRVPPLESRPVGVGG